MKRNAGFTVIELIVVVVILLTAAILFLNQKQKLEATARDNARKVDINTLYHNLEKVYYAKNKSYPRQLDENSLPAVQADTFLDPSGIKINESKPNGLSQITSDYSYEPKECNQETGSCASYVLRTKLELEADYAKESAN